MKFTTTLGVITMLVLTSLLFITISTANSFAQNDTNGTGNQTGSSSANDTAMSNQTGSGNISGIARF